MSFLILRLYFEYFKTIETVEYAFEMSEMTRVILTRPFCDKTYKYMYLGLSSSRHEKILILAYKYKYLCDAY